MKTKTMKLVTVETLEVTRVRYRFWSRSKAETIRAVQNDLVPADMILSIDRATLNEAQSFRKPTGYIHDDANRPLDECENNIYDNVR